ncbi:MAG: zinc ribbon domain-containing protein [Acidobacteriota bacterium]
MPIYEYQCDKCGNHIELMQKVGDPAPKRCEKCRKGKMEKLFSRTSFQLKGSGWYASDYAKKPAASGKSGSKTEKKTEAKAESKTESKSETSSSDTTPASAA